MTTLNITMNLDNAAFEDDRSAEIRRLLTWVADLLDHHADAGVMHDINGNDVGGFSVTS